MTSAERYRRFILGTSALVFAGTLVELWLAEHTAEWLQWIPFGLSVVGLISVGKIWFQKFPAGHFLPRVGLGLCMSGGIVGVVIHFVRNLQFATEIKPNESALSLVGDALRGASPLFASGILVLGGVLGFAATIWRE